MKLKIGVLGAGHLGKIHIKCILQCPEVYELVGFYDPDDESAAKAMDVFGVKRFVQLEQLIDQVDVVDVVTPTLSHFDCASLALRKLKHVFIEKPLTNTLDEARELMKIANEARVKVQVGHVERFNPAFLSARGYLHQPMFIEAHRLSIFNPRGTDVSIVLDLMIHDIDIVLSSVASNIKSISASGVSVVSKSPDIANARIEFDNGCVANITASRMSMKNMRKMRFFQKDAYVAVDFLDKEAEILRLGEPGSLDLPQAMEIDLGPERGQKVIGYERPKIPEQNAIREELLSFACAIQQGSLPLVTIEDGYKALETAYKILEKIERNQA
ncbi:MAG: Gfo/Idh/MocA family protein [Bacteroidia bacterium]